jgi:hypothetical protein
MLVVHMQYKELLLCIDHKMLGKQGEVSNLDYGAEKAWSLDLKVG